jgi:hypothetical protein
LETTLPSDIRTLVESTNTETSAEVAIARTLGLALPWGVSSGEEDSGGAQLKQLQALS